jgi:RimJ/RimL family protein N-acetyltransferase
MSALETERLDLRPFEDSDIDVLFAIQGDREHMRHTFWAESREACAQWMRNYESRRAVDGFAPWVLVCRGDGRIVGWGGLNLDPRAPEWGVEVSYFIAQTCERKGFATELVHASLTHGFTDLAFEKIGAFAKMDNHASIRVLEKCGFKLLRYEPALDRNHYELRREEWSAGYHA